MIVYIYNIGVDLYNGFNGLRHRINWTYFTVLDGLAHPLYSILHENKLRPLTDTILDHIKKSSYTISKGKFFQDDHSKIE